MSDVVQVIGNPTVQITSSTLPYYPDAYVPTDLGYQAWTYDPVHAVTGTVTTGGVLYLAAVPVRNPVYVQRVYITLSGAASGATPGENWLGLYSSSGTQLGAATDITTSLTTTGAPIGVSLSAGTILLQPGWVWIGCVFNASTTLPQLATTGTAAFGNVNGQLTTAAYRYTSNGTGHVTFPASITPGSNSTTTMIPFWGAIS